MIGELEGRDGRRNAFSRATFAAVVVGTAHIGAFVWLAKHTLSMQPPDSVQGVPIDLDLLAVAPPEPPHDVAPPAASAPPEATPDATATPVQEPPPPTQEPSPPPLLPEPPAPSRESLPPRPEPPPPSPELTPTPQPTMEAPPPSPELSPELPNPTPTQTPPPNALVEPAPPPPKPQLELLRPKLEPSKPKPEAAKPKPRPTSSPSPRIDTEKLERERAAVAEKAHERAEARRQARAAPAKISNEITRESKESREGVSERPVSSGTNLSTWRGAVLARISEYKPLSNGSSGTAVVAFTVNGSGQVVSASLVRSSGDTSLDAACVAMVRRASPLPPPPPELGGHVNLTVPVRFQ